MPRARDNLSSFYDAWYFLVEHKIFDARGKSQFMGSLRIHVVKIDPKTGGINKREPEKNTSLRNLLQCGPWITPERLSEATRFNNPFGVFFHDPQLDALSSGFESAGVKLAKNLRDKYGSKPVVKKQSEKPK